MEFEKTRNRKSRAPWQSSNTNNAKPNPYATASFPGNDRGLLQVPPPHGSDLTRTISGETIGTTRKHTRRNSIHQGASQSHRRSFTDATAPPLPSLDQLKAHVSSNQTQLSVKERIYKEVGNGSAQDVDDYYKSLLKQKQQVTKSIKDNINLNQRNILELTKKLVEIQHELVGLRGDTKELHSVLQYFTESSERRLELERSSLSIPKRKDRSSVMLLTKDWENELQSLFNKVEGASKFIQPIPGRHVVVSSDRWQEVTVGNWKANNITHIYVLNDLLLIANKKALSKPNPGDLRKLRTEDRLQAINCWPLTQVKLSEIKPPTNVQTDASSKVYFINIKTRSLSFVYQTDRYDHFLKIIDSFNKGRNEMVQKARLDKSRDASFQALQPGDSREEKRQLRESLRSSGNYEGIFDEKRRSNPTSRNSRDFVLHDISARVHSRNRSHDFNTTMENNSNPNNTNDFFKVIKIVEARLDDVDVNISHNNYQGAADLISMITTRLAELEKDLTRQIQTKEIQDKFFLLEISKLKIQNRKENIHNSLQFDLTNNISRLTPSDIELKLQHYNIFGELDLGITTYLEAVSLYLSTTASRLIVGLQGSTKIDVVNYLSNLVVINVAIVTRTVKTYDEKIVPILKQHGNVDTSGLVNWCVEEITKLSKQINKNLYGTLLTSSGINIETNQTIYKIKDEKLYTEFTNLMIPQLNELKKVGINVDYIFEPILMLK